MARCLRIMLTIFLLSLSTSKADKVPPQRIISLAPAISEILFAIGAGSNLVGRTSACNHPPAAKKIPIVSHYRESDYEEILIQQPDLAILMEPASEQRDKLEALGIPCHALRLSTIEDIQNAIRTIGTLCNARRKAQKVVSDLRKRTRDLLARTFPAQKPRVMLVASHPRNNISEAYLIGGSSFHNELLKMANGKNVYDGPLPCPLVGREAILRFNPQVIIDLLPELNQAPRMSRSRARELWDAFPTVDAVRNERVYLLTENHVSIPGPRYVEILDDFVSALYPETTKGTPDVPYSHN